MSKSVSKPDLKNIAQAPLPIQKLYQVAMESRDEVLEKLCIEQYIEEAMPQEYEIIDSSGVTQPGYWVYSEEPCTNSCTVVYGS